MDPIDNLGTLRKLLDPSSIWLVVAVSGTIAAFVASWMWTLVLDCKHRPRKDRLRRTLFLETGQLVAGDGMEKLENVSKEEVARQKQALVQQQQTGMSRVLLAPVDVAFTVRVWIRACVRAQGVSSLSFVTCTTRGRRRSDASTASSPCFCRRLTTSSSSHGRRYRNVSCGVGVSGPWLTASLVGNMCSVWPFYALPSKSQCV